MNLINWEINHNATSNFLSRMCMIYVDSVGITTTVTLEYKSVYTNYLEYAYFWVSLFWFVAITHNESIAK